VWRQAQFPLPLPFVGDDDVLDDEQRPFLWLSCVMIELEWSCFVQLHLKKGECNLERQRHSKPKNSSNVMSSYLVFFEPFARK